MVCIDGVTGLVVWKTTITDRADSGLVLSADLKVIFASRVGFNDTLSRERQGICHGALWSCSSCTRGGSNWRLSTAFASWLRPASQEGY